MRLPIVALAAITTLLFVQAPPARGEASVAAHAGSVIAHTGAVEHMARVLAHSQAARPLEGKLIVIDPGHNPGNAAHARNIGRSVDAGTLRKACDTVGTATAAGYPEWRHNLRVARRLARILVARGARIVLTHNGKQPRWGPCITRRARIANRLDADVAISIHADGHLGTGRGFHIIHPVAVSGLTDDIAAPSKRLARDVRKTYARATGLPRATYAGKNGLHARDDIGGLNLSDVPKVLIETGNMRNTRDAALLTSGYFQWREARGMAAGITRFLTR